MSEYQYYDPKFVPAAFGLNNTGVICWCNSLIQLMLGLSALNRTLLECEEELKDNIFAREYIKVLKGALSANDRIQDSNASANILRAFLMRMRQKGVRANMGAGQECANEAFTLFIDMFGCPRVEKLFSNVYELIIECTGCKKKASSVRDNAYQISMFTNVKLDTAERFCTFLRVHPSECEYYKCDCGTKMVNFYRAEKLKMLREIVVIVFNKFQTKDNRWFPSELAFKAKDGSILTYKLVGKIEHVGSQFGGHYWAQSLRGTWYRLNDSGVSAGDPSPTAETFMIAYHLVAPTNPAS